MSNASEWSSTSFRRRASKPKVRTGCNSLSHLLIVVIQHSNLIHDLLDCKIRRIKCDEARPACYNCVRAGRIGRICDGYPPEKTTIVSTNPWRPGKGHWLCKVCGQDGDSSVPGHTCNFNKAGPSREHRLVAGVDSARVTLSAQSWPETISFNIPLVLQPTISGRWAEATIQVDPFLSRSTLEQENTTVNN